MSNEGVRPCPTCGGGTYAEGDEPGNGFTCKQLREEGRRDILRQIAKKVIDPQVVGSPIYGTHCCFCGGRGYEPIQHDSSCLWLQAQSLTAPGPVK